MVECILKYSGFGLFALLGYLIISNTLWLLFGSKLLQSLPGVNVRGSTGTLKIAILLIMTITGFLIWIVRTPFSKLGIFKEQSLQGCVSHCIQSASKLFAKRL
jgi:hypothetical protein